MDHHEAWCARLLTPLPAEWLGVAVPADDSRWEWVETELVKLGSLAHGQLDLDAVAETCLRLLETRTKDMRVVAQLLRCLQHPAKANSMGLALHLLMAWLRAYWSVAWPAHCAQKQKLMQQIIKRFDGGLPRVIDAASGEELAQLLAQVQALALLMTAIGAEAGTLLDGLLAGLKRGQRQQSELVATDAPPGVASAQGDAQPGSGAGVPSSAMSGAVGKLTTQPVDLALDSSSERAWRQTQLQMAQLLIERHPDSAMGYRLRRHAIWSGIMTPPLTHSGVKTQLAPVCADRVASYEAALGQADLALWQQIEQSLVLAPYWFVGHYLSAQVAEQLGWGHIARAIAQELEAFLSRMPMLAQLTFNDGSPFLPESCQQWLRPARQAILLPAIGSNDELAQRVETRLAELGVEAALRLLDEELPQLSEPRARFYAQLLQCDLLEQVGMSSLAQQGHRQLWHEANRLGLAQWEPGLVSRLECRTGLLVKQVIDNVGIGSSCYV